MKVTLLIYFSLILLSCTSLINNDKESSLNADLMSMENFLFSNPDKVINFTASLESKGLTQADNHYKTLLYSIAYEHKFGKYSDKESASETAEWFRTTGDSYNLCRSLLYKSIANFSSEIFDSTSYCTIKEAESLYILNDFNDLNLASKLFLYLGRLYSIKSEFTQAEVAIRRSMDYSSLVNNNTAFLNSALELFSLQLTLGRYSECLISISSFGDIDSLPPYLEYNLYNALFKYHSSKRDSYIAIEYLRKILAIEETTEISINYPRTYYKIASLYKRTGIADSALNYAIKATSYPPNKNDSETHLYYSLLAEIYYEKGEHQNSALMYKNAHKSYLDSESDKNRIRNLEIQKRFDLNEKDYQVSMLTKQKAIHLNMIFAIFVVMLFMTLFFVFKLRSLQDELHNTETALKEIGKDRKCLWLISEIYKSSSFILPQLIDNVYLEAVRTRRVSNETFDSLNKIIDIANSASRSSLSSITNGDKFAELFGHIEELNKLTDFEKIIYILSQENLSNTEIANFLNSSQSSIRTMRGKIQKKIQNNDAENNNG